MGASTVDSPLVYTTTSTPLRWSPWANSAINNSVPPYLFGGTAMNGGAIRATLIGFKLNNTNNDYHTAPEKNNIKSIANKTTNPQKLHKPQIQYKENPIKIKQHHPSDD